MVSSIGTPDLLRQVSATPAWFPFMLDSASDRVLMVRKTEADYKAASFLDGRSLSPTADRWVVGWNSLASALPAGARADAHFIFHIGHVGSTLVSRLLDEIPDFLALREPLILRTLAEALGPAAPAGAWTAGAAAGRLATVRALLSRTFRLEQRAIVKATSFTSEIAAGLVAPHSRALFLYAHPQRYIAGILAGEASRQELGILTPSRVQRLRSRRPELGPIEEPRSEAQAAAIGWACEMTSLENEAEGLADRVMWLDFDLFLKDPASHLADIAAFFGTPISALQANAICAGPLMRRYSKAPEYEYSPQLRQDLLTEAALTQGPAIAGVLSWLVDLAKRFPQLSRALERALA